MPAQLYTFIEGKEQTENVLCEMNNLYQNGQPVYVNISSDNKTFVPTFDVIDNISGLPRMRFAYNTQFKGDHYLIDDIFLFIINKPIEVFFIEDKSNENSPYKYRIGIENTQEPEKISTLQTMNTYGKTFNYVMDVETSSRCIVDGDILGTYQKISLSALPYMYSVYDSMEEINAELGFKDKIVNGPNNLYRVTGYSSCFSCPSEMITTNKDTSGTCLIGRIEKTQDVQLAFGNTIIPCKIAWLRTGFGEIPFTICPTRDDFDDYKVNKYVMMFAYVKADFGKKI